MNHLHGPAVAAWCGDRQIARSEHTVYLEGNYYFPADSVLGGVLSASRLRTVCFWKGIAHYRHAEIDGVRLPNAAWSYPRPSPLARTIKGMIAFDQGTGITVREEAP